jgi:hypothetical protein
MVGFHIDLNVAQFSRVYLEKWLKILAQEGYDTILWEIENNIAWDSCPECASPDAFSKSEFGEILAYSRKLGLEPIPLFQTIGHVEYVLKHDPYKHLREIPEDVYQYCPRNPEVVPFVVKWIEEYFEVFTNLRYFHLGADEAWSLGSCDRCRQYAQQYSLSKLYVDHINAVAKPVLDRGVIPMIWGDMILHHPEAISELEKQMVVFDWHYTRNHGLEKVVVWGASMQAKDEISADVLHTYESYMFPYGDEPGRKPETFYHTDFLVDHGFETVVCPASSSYGDNVFNPRNWFHLINIYDSARKGFSKPQLGCVLTSWSVHLFPYEFQRAHIQLMGQMAQNKNLELTAFLDGYVEQMLGTSGKAFWKACALVSSPSLFTHTSTLGFDKKALPVAKTHVIDTLQKMEQEGTLEKAQVNTLECLAGYKEALGMFLELQSNAADPEKLLPFWILATRNLINRAACTAFLITHLANLHDPSINVAAEEKEKATALLYNLRDLKIQTTLMYEPIQKSTRRAELISLIFDSTEYAMERVLGEHT